ncbi:MAG: hypothetical protein ACPGQS_05160 [Bradymonadia bacterium]
MVNVNIRNTDSTYMIVIIVIFAISLFGCETQTTGTEAGEACVTSDLVSQCPANTTPELEANASAVCQETGTLDLTQGVDTESDDSVSYSRACIGTGQCKLICRFNDPCEFGVARVSPMEGIICNEASTACGNGQCESGESAESCPVDCAAECTPETQRCTQDGGIQACDLRGFWGETVSCGAGSRCSNANGEPACAQFNECLMDNGGCGAPERFTCEDTPDAPPTCSDIDECITDNGGCEQRCVNTDGGYDCECDSGYILSPNGSSCADIDECETNNGNCAQQCTNTIGSYTCSCDAFYRLASDEQNCDDIDECETDYGGCDVERTQCLNQIGGPPLCEPRDCSINNGGCGEYYVCVSDSSFGEGNETGRCVDRAECRENNGDCGSARDFACIEQVGAPPRCEARSGTAQQLMCMLDDENKLAWMRVTNEGCRDLPYVPDDQHPWGEDFSCDDALAVDSLMKAAWCYESAAVGCCHCLRDIVLVLKERTLECTRNSFPEPMTAFEILDDPSLVGTFFLVSPTTFADLTCGARSILDTPCSFILDYSLLDQTLNFDQLTNIGQSAHPLIHFESSPSYPFGIMRHVLVTEQLNGISVEIDGANLLSSTSVIRADGRIGYLHVVGSQFQTPRDQDGDAYPDEFDNCEIEFNPDQVDTDGDGYGDACDPCAQLPGDDTQLADRDGDGIGDLCDNCPDRFNDEQADLDNDGVGDLCDDCPIDRQVTSGCCTGYIECLDSQPRQCIPNDGWCNGVPQCDNGADESSCN